MPKRSRVGVCNLFSAAAASKAVRANAANNKNPIKTTIEKIIFASIIFPPFWLSFPP